ncbi:MAG: glycosyltransferase, partial [Clostridiales bacterium]|nr:glycosyltransferase [Clostridiales bacterium]
MKKIVLTGGGTAGHVTPNIALLPALCKMGCEIHYIGDVNGMEKRLMAPFDFVTYHGISTGKLRRYLSVQNLKDPFKVLKGISQSKKLLGEIRPDVIFAKGGFVSVPVVMAAKKHKIPVVLHESDFTIGLANRISAPRASIVCTSFAPTVNEVKGGHGVWTGS